MSSERPGRPTIDGGEKGDDGHMTTQLLDLEPATREMARLIGGVPDEHLGRPTPCPAYTLGHLIDHVGGLALAFMAAATKSFGGAASQGPSGDASRLGSDWRSRITRDLAALAGAWRDPQFSGPGHEAEREGLFGPEVDVPASAPLLDRVVGLAGRDPAWSPG